MSGRDPYCPLSQIQIASNFTITDPDNTGIPNFYIQISTGYEEGPDRIFLTGSHPNIVESWNPSEGRLTLSPASGAEMLFDDLQAAVRSIVYESSSPAVAGEKFFSFTIDSISFLPSNGHYYEYIELSNVNWNTARQLAEDRRYFGLQGYLATITAADESQLVGEQATGTGWIGGSDAATEGTWVWVTGPETGTVFWQGGPNGSTPNYAFWNTGEPNNLDDEDYAHITDPAVGIEGSWNDLPAQGGTGLFEPRGYIVEYGGMPGDPDINVSGSTSVFVPALENTTSDSSCGPGVVTLTAESIVGEILWYDAAAGGNLLGTGNTFVTPTLTTTTNFYATVSVDGCLTVARTEIAAVVNDIPTVLNPSGALICAGQTATITAVPSNGLINWYESPTATVPVFTGNVFTTPELSSTTQYYAEAVIDNCSSATRTEVTVEVDTQEPSFDIPSEVTLCTNIGSVDIEPTNALDAYDYVWSNAQGDPIGSGEMITITEPGNYSITATALSGCVSESRQISVRESSIANLLASHVSITDKDDNNQILIFTNDIGIGDYEYALDNPNGPYSQQKYYDNLAPGVHVLYIRDRNGCGIQEYRFSVLNHPLFFTPNGDNVNEVWNLTGLVPDAYSKVTIRIFNRFGLVVATLDQFSLGWDGNFGGNRMPSTDYWFVAELTDINGYSNKRTGHFSLLRSDR